MAASTAASTAAEAAQLEQLSVFGCELIQKMGILLRLPQVAVSSAQVSFHRFYARKSMRKFDVRYTALGTLFLATKIEECPRKMRDVLAVFMHLEQKRKGVEPPQPIDIYSNRYATYKERLIRAEREILKELGFVLYTEHPHKFLFHYVKLLTVDETAQKDLSQYAWNFINDAQRTDACIRYGPETISCAALWMAGRVLQIKLPSASGDAPPWWELFDARKEDMDDVCARVIALYSRGKAEYIELQPAGAGTALSSTTAT